MDRGFSLVEVLVAGSLTTIATLALAQLATGSVRVNQIARSTTVATVLAIQKMEQLRALTWAIDAAGLPQSDTTTDTTVVPERPGGAGLSPSPPASLLRNTTGYCDFLDAMGRGLPAAVTPPRGTVFVRRWSIEPLPAGDALVIRVSVSPVVTDRSTGSARRADEVRFLEIKTRKAG